MITFGSLCSGIEAASAAWLPLGWRCLWLSEIDPAACAVLAHHYPETPNLGDMTAPDFAERALAIGRPDVLIAGTPCQAFSVSGKREGLADARGNLTLRFVQLADQIGPDFILWENVPGVLSDETNAFGCLLAGLAGAERPFEPAGRSWPGAGVASGPDRRMVWRVLDAQYFGVPQRRRRVFIVAGAGPAGVDPAPVLFERAGVPGDSAPGGQARQGVAAGAGGGAHAGGGLAHTLRGEGHDASEDGTGRGIPLVSATVTAKWSKGAGGPAGDKCQNLIAFHGSQDPDVSGRVTHPCGRNQGQETCVAIMPTLAAGAHPGGANRQDAAQIAFAIAQVQRGAVRRLTPRECERLQGFPDDYTLVPHRGRSMTDSPRYKMIGNSMAVPVIRWIGRRMAAQLATMPAEKAQP